MSDTFDQDLSTKSSEELRQIMQDAYRAQMYLEADDFACTNGSGVFIAKWARLYRRAEQELLDRVEANH